MWYLLVDAWNDGSIVTVWLKDPRGVNFFLRDLYYPLLWVRTFTKLGETILYNLIQKRVLKEDFSQDSIHWSKEFSLDNEDKKGLWQDLWSGNWVSARVFRIIDLRKMNQLIQEADYVCDSIEFYGCDLSPIQYYFLEKDLYPMAKVQIQRIKPNSSGSSFNFIKIEKSNEWGDIPPFLSITIFSDYGRYIPIGTKNPLRILTSPRDCITLKGDMNFIFHELNVILRKKDPDLVFTNGGDEFLFPQIFEHSNKINQISFLDRDTVVTKRNTKIQKRTFYSYGRILFKTTAFPLFGRLHLDKNESFFYSESELEGILEMAKFSRVPIQRIARASPGTAMSAMEDEIALKKRILIPRTKGKASSIKPLSVLLKVDQGGLTFRPKPGYYENVIELDFRSLYPSLMSLHNISGETINCSCCKNQSGKKIPYTPYHTCTQRRGIVSDTVEILIQRREKLKEELKNPELSSEVKAKLEKRATALKWCLVTCFGYTGYKNAKFGRREAHEAITAWGRHSIIHAKEIAESMGYKLLHGLTDSMWLTSEKKYLLEENSIQKLIQEVYNQLGLKLLYEAYYSWIVFNSSKVKVGFSVPTRYYGRMANGEMKVRGIAMRRKNTPKIIADFQKDALKILSWCCDFQEVESKFSEFQTLRDMYWKRILLKQFQPEEVCIRQSITKKTGDFVVHSASKIVLDAILENGVTLEGGQTIEYIVINRKSSNYKDRYKPLYQFDIQKDSIDLGFYKALFQDAWEEILGIFFPEPELFYSPMIGD